MPKSKTYFAQVPLAVVQEAVEEQTAQMREVGQPNTKKKDPSSSTKSNSGRRKRTLKQAR